MDGLKNQQGRLSIGIFHACLREEQAVPVLAVRALHRDAGIKTLDFQGPGDRKVGRARKVFRALRSTQKLNWEKGSSRQKNQASETWATCKLKIWYCFICPT